MLDILFANGGNYDNPGVQECSRVFLNPGKLAAFQEVTADVFGYPANQTTLCRDMFLTRAIRVADVNGDGRPDIFLATSYHTQSQLYLGLGNLQFKNVSSPADNYLPQSSNSFGDATFGDVDGDGDLDLALADWGYSGDEPNNPMKNDGGLTRLWLNDGQGHFTDVTDKQMPTDKDSYVRFSWDLDLVDVDNDFDLDLMVSSKLNQGGILLENDGHGHFRNVTQEKLPKKTNNYDYEAMDLNGDGFLDVVTINDGGWVNTGDPATDDPYARRNSVFFNDRKGGFIDVTSKVLAKRDNPGLDDNLSIFLDFDSDGDADVLIGSLSGNDRVLINDGRGNLHLDDNWLNTFTYSPDPSHPKTPSHGTLGMAVADLDGDHKLEVVDGQGEVENYFEERVYFGKNIREDTAMPVISLVEKVNRLSQDNIAWVRARVHDNKSPVLPNELAVKLRWQSGERTGVVPMQWYGEYLWRAGFKVSNSPFSYQVCATDAALNSECSNFVTIGNGR